MKDEQVTFDGIPIPLTLETILNAMEKSISLVSVMGKQGFETVRYRQYRAFRARILQKYHALELLVQLQNEGLVQRKARIAELETVQNCTGYNNQGSRRVAELEQQLAEKDKAIEVRNVRIFNRDVQLFGKDARIAELEGELDWANGIIEQMVAKLAEKDEEIGDISHYFDYIFEQLEDCRKEIIEKDIALEMIEAGYNGLQYEMNKQLAEKDHEIRVLKKYIKDHGYKRL